MAVLLQATTNLSADANWTNGAAVSVGAVATDNNAGGASLGTTVQTGTGTVSTGTLGVFTGAASAGSSGVLSLYTGTGTVNSGNVLVYSGVPGAAGISGNVALSTGATAGAGTSGNITMTTGTTAGGTRGNIALAATRVTTLDDMPIGIGAASHVLTYVSAGTRTDLTGADLTAGGAGANTDSLRIDTGDRVKNDNNVGVPTSGAITVASGDTAQTTAIETGPTSGAVSVQSGDTDVTFAAATGGDSGQMRVFSGNTGISAAVAANGGASGPVFVQSGDCSSVGGGTSGASGSVSIESGFSTDANTGNVLVASGIPVGAGVSGNVALSSSLVTTGTSGNIVLSTGAATGAAGTSGDIALSTGVVGLGGTPGVIEITGPAQLRSFNRLSDRFELKWVAGARGKPAANADIIVGGAAQAIADPYFELVGTSAGGAMVTTNSTYYAEGGLVIATGVVAADFTVIAPHLDANQSAWTQITWSTDREVHWECLIQPTAAITNRILYAGLKLTNVPASGTDNDEAFFRFEDSVAAGNWQAVHDVGGGGLVETDTGVTVAINTTYHLKISIQADRTALMYINGDLVDTTAVLDVVNLIPYIGISDDGTGAAVDVRVFGQAISRLFGA